jgi:hypothetical protein
VGHSLDAFDGRSSSHECARDEHSGLIVQESVPPPRDLAANAARECDDVSGRVCVLCAALTRECSRRPRRPRGSAAASPGQAAANTFACASHSPLPRRVSRRCDTRLECLLRGRAWRLAKQWNRLCAWGNAHNHSWCMHVAAAAVAAVASGACAHARSWRAHSRSAHARAHPRIVCLASPQLSSRCADAWRGDPVAMEHAHEYSHGPGPAAHPEAQTYEHGSATDARLLLVLAVSVP